jgi:hypothetical protein
MKLARSVPTPFLLQMALLAVLPAAAAAQSIAPAIPPIPVHVVNPTSQSRTLEPVSFGVPIPQQPPVTDLGSLVLKNAAGQAVPAQFKALSRWGADRSVLAAPLKWVLVTVRPTLGPNAIAHYGLEAGAALATPGLAVTTGATSITVTTHPGASFAVPVSSFAPLAQATIGGSGVLSGPGGIDVRDPSGALVPAVVTAPTVVEESGNERVVLRQRGSLAGLKYTCRWYFHAGRNDVAIDFRLENPAAYGLFSTSIPDGQVYFDALSLTLPIAGSTQTVTSALASHSVPTSQSYEVLQDFGTAPTYDVLAGFTCAEKLNGTTVNSTTTYGGALDVSGANGGVTMTVERFWQNFPKAFVVQGGAAHVVLFPGWGNGPEFIGIYDTPFSPNPVDPMALTNYRFEGGRWKTHRVVLDFHGPGARTSAQVANEAVRVNAPLVGFAEPSAVRKSFATGTLFVERAIVPPTTSTWRYQRFFDMLVDNQAADHVPNTGRIGLPKFLTRGGTWGDRQPYGWENYGDLPWADGYCNLHYNWPANLLLEFLRTGDWRYFDRGRDMAVWRRDYGQNHGTDTGENWRGCCFYEKGWWHGNSAEGGNGHNWALGTLLHYALTGDEGSREAALENVDFCKRNSPAWWSGWWGSRIPGRAIEALVDAFNFLGDQNCLLHAGSGVDQFQSFEVADGMHGWHLNPANGTTSVWMDNVFYTAAAKYVLASGDASNLPFLDRMRDWFKADCIVWPTGPVTATTLPMVRDVWAPPPASGTFSVHHGWEMVEALSYSAVIHADITDLQTAGVLFEGLTRYWQSGVTFSTFNPLDAATFSPITMRPMQYPSTESKVVGGVLNAGYPFLAVWSYVIGNW